MQLCLTFYKNINEICKADFVKSRILCQPLNLVLKFLLITNEAAFVERYVLFKS